MTVILTLLLCSLLQAEMFNRATNFDQDIGGWDVSSGTDFVSLGLILVLCSSYLNMCGFWNDSITDFVTLLIAAEWYVCRSYQLQSEHWLVECIQWNRLCEFRLDSCTLLILT